MKSAKEAFSVIAIAACSVMVGIGTAYLLDRGGVASLLGMSKPVVFFTPLVAAIIAGVALLRVRRMERRGGRSRDGFPRDDAV